MYMHRRLHSYFVPSPYDSNVITDADSHADPNANDPCRPKFCDLAISNACQTMVSSGRAACGRGSGRVQAPLARGRGGAPQPSGRSQAALASGRGGAPQSAVQELVDAILQFGYLLRQAKHSTTEEKHLAVRLIKARKAGSLSSEQEAALGNLAQGAAEAQAASGVHYYEHC